MNIHPPPSPSLTFPPSHPSLPTRSRNLQELSVLMSLQAAMSFSVSHAPVAWQNQSLWSSLVTWSSFCKRVLVFGCFRLMPRDGMQWYVAGRLGAWQSVMICYCMLNCVFLYVVAGFFVISCDAVWHFFMNVTHRGGCDAVWYSKSLKIALYYDPWPLPVNDLPLPRESRTN